MDALTDEFDNPAGEANSVEEAGIPEVYSRKGRRLLRPRTRAQEAREHQSDYSEGQDAPSEQSQRPKRLTRPRGLACQFRHLHCGPFLQTKIPIPSPCNVRFAPDPVALCGRIGSRKTASSIRIETRRLAGLLRSRQHTLCKLIAKSQRHYPLCSGSCTSSI